MQKRYVMTAYKELLTEKSQIENKEQASEEIEVLLIVAGEDKNVTFKSYLKLIELAFNIKEKF